ncbi:uncharacterized protein LOC116842431 [Odontomachus brunneus]|uniref:uncharacterized protein LOC116842431 n=1 Tax=Odontomachus brunneus TaxID=486640 RepID=UPI0013F1B69B|nr:uncharacterized protein LOC116842431 [Odontomachus brunneus]
MDQLRWRTPSKINGRNRSLVNSPRLHTTPIKQNGIRPKRTTYQNNTGYFTTLPSYMTPPSALANVIRRNPFEADLTNRLHLPVISPTIFTKMPDSLSQQSPEFSWSIDELAHINPAKIEESPTQQVCSPDPEVELRAQAAIDRFFKQKQIIPSPWQMRKEIKRPYTDIGIPSRVTDDMNFTKEFLKSKKEAWTQTVLSLPVNLPQYVEDTLKPFCTFTQEQNVDNEDVNSSNNSLRRKLFPNYEGADNDNESISSLSSVEMNGSIISSCSPPQSGMFIHGTLKGSLKNRRHSNKSVSLSSPCISPIRNENDMPCKKIRRSRSNTRLDRTKDISINTEESRNLHDDDLLSISRDTNIEGTEDDYKITIVNNGKTNLCDSVSIGTLSKYTNPIGSTVQINSVESSEKNHDTISFITATRMNKDSMHKNHKQSITIDTLGPWCTSNSVQDTGYQTYSMSSTMHTVDSCNISLQNHKVQPKEHIVNTTFKDFACSSVQLSWKDDMRNVFSSTPSKCKNEKES